jgi:sec-independent protein translocase protein TatC
MVDAGEMVTKAREAVTNRAELPGMTLMQHLDELRRRIINSVLFLVAGYVVAVIFAPRLYLVLQAPLSQLKIQLNFSHPADLVNLRYIQIPLAGGAILAAPFILYQIWLFIAPALYSHEKRYVIPFMGSAILLFLGGAFLGYYFVFPGLLKFLISDLGTQLGVHPLISIEEYTGFFFALILGMGATFELPVVMVFLAMFGLCSASFYWRHIRYAILLIFIIAAIITPTPDITTMCVFASPMMVLYLVGIAGAWFVHPSRRKKKKEQAA